MNMTDFIDLISGCATDRDLADLYIKVHSMDNFPVFLSRSAVLDLIVSAGERRGLTRSYFLTNLHERAHMENFRHRVTQWAEDRNLIDGSDTAKQSLKLLEEAGEVGGALARGNQDLLRDAIGDTMVVLTIMDAQIHRGQSRPSELEPLFSILHDAMDRAKAGAPLSLRRAHATLKQLAENHGLSIVECLDQAWSDIKDRRGRMIDGVFVKEADLCDDSVNVQSSTTE